MSFLRVLFCPVKALGSVTINGTPITRGETIQQFGELRIDLGTFRQDDVVLYNDAQQWTPVTVEGNILVFSMQSNGKYFIYNNARKVVFDFAVNIGQDFIIDYIAGFNSANPDTPGAILESGNKYWQRASQGRNGTYTFWVKSTGTDITNLSVTSTNNVAVTKRLYVDDLGVEYVRIYTTYANCEEGKPASISVGNVLVSYIETII